jgi:hypothetical protein
MKNLKGYFVLKVDSRQNRKGRWLLHLLKQFARRLVTELASTSFLDLIPGLPIMRRVRWLDAGLIRPPSASNQIFQAPFTKQTPSW